MSFNALPLPDAEVGIPNAPISSFPPSPLWRRCLVDDEPVDAEQFHRLDELLEIHGFPNVAVDPKVVGGDHVLVFFRRGQHHHGNPPGPLIRFDDL